MIRRIVCILALIALLFVPFVVRAAEAAGFARATTGVEADYIQIGDWTVYTDAIDGVSMSIFGQKPGGEPVELVANTIGLTPAVDSFIYYGTAADGKQRWQLVYPDEPEHRVLPISWAEEVIGADDAYIWYYAMGDGPNRVIYRVGKDGKGKKRLGTLQGTVIARMDDGQILSCFYARNQVRLWDKGKYTTLFQAPKDMEIRSVSTDGSHILMQTDGEFGFLEDGAFIPLFPGHVCASVNARAQIVLVSFAGADLLSVDECAVHLVDFEKSGIAYLGDIPSAPMIEFRIEADAVTVYSGDELTRFDYPETFEPFAARDIA